MGPVTQTHFGEWASASRTFVAITDLMAVVQREVDMFFVLIFESMHACSNSYFMPAEVDCSYFLAGMTSPPDDCRVVEMAHLDTLGYGGELVSAPECLRNGARTLFHFFNAALT